ncbi:MAG: UDP-glucose/GDP-mannose dehydrogenase family protein, partial [Candidatus Marinimicrobia bacterium]|nr:UDP-glucose/GDP-mannose dehydrogenase family protein [Candidatus Neomarinimicrobiota bacterium]
MKISIIGTGYVGLVTGTCLAHMGNIVTCMDVHEGKIADLKRGKLPIYEPGLLELLNSNIKENRLHFTTDLQQAVESGEFIFIAVGTPGDGDGDGKADISTVLQVAGQLGDLIDDYRIVIVKSTVPVGTSVNVATRIRERLAARNVTATVDVVSNPEFLKEGKAVSDFMNPDRIIIGVESDHARERLEALYAPFIRTGEGSIMFMDIPSAELTKYAANAMLATRISFMNEIAAVCEATGANVDHVRAGIGSDDRIGRRFLFPGVGYGGSCFPKDVKALARTALDFGIEMKIMGAVDAVNVAQKKVLVEKVKAHYKTDDLSGKTFAIWGLSFKPETDDVRESPAAVIIADLLDAGAKVQAYDPVAIDSFRQHFDLDIDYRNDMYDCLTGADAVLLVTEWHHFRRPEFGRIAQLLKEPVIFDGRNQYEPQYADDRGFTYISIGRPPVLNP